MNPGDFAEARDAAVALWGERALVRFTWTRRGWTATAGRTVPHGIGVEFSRTGMGPTAGAALAALAVDLRGPHCPCRACGVATTTNELCPRCREAGCSRFVAACDCDAEGAAA